MPSSCATVDMSFGSVDIPLAHVSLGTCLDHSCLFAEKQKCNELHSYFPLLPLLSNSCRASVEPTRQMALGDVSEETCSHFAYHIKLF